MTNKRPAVFVALLLFGSWGQAEPAQGTEDFTCQPDSFSATVQKQRLHLEGELEVPTPGYSYQLSRGSRSEKTHYFQLALYPPQGPAPSVIGSVDIKGEFEIRVPNRKIEITIEKDFSWGPNRITCERGKETGEKSP